MKIKFRLWDYPFGGHRRADCMFTAGTGVGREGFIHWQREGLPLEWHQGGKARVTACHASDADRAGGPGPAQLGSGSKLEFSPLRNQCCFQGMCVCSSTGSFPRYYTLITRKAFSSFSSWKATDLSQEVSQGSEEQKGWGLQDQSGRLKLGFGGRALALHAQNRGFNP